MPCWDMALREHHNERRKVMNHITQEVKENVDYMIIINKELIHELTKLNRQIERSYNKLRADPEFANKKAMLLGILTAPFTLETSLFLFAYINNAQNADALAREKKIFETKFLNSPTNMRRRQPLRFER